MKVDYVMLICLVLCLNTGDASSSEEALVGHLKPLGNQRLPTVPIDEFTPETAPNPQKFYEDYVKPSRAAIFRNAMTETPAFKLWTDDYLKEHYGDLEVRLEGKKEKVHSTPIGEKYMGRDNIRHFVDTYHLPDSKTYIVSELPKQMYHEVGVLPSLGACGGMTKSFVEIDLWWSGGDSRSVIHKDAFNQINCLYRGTKYWKLFEYKYEKWLHKHPEPEGEIGGFSDINVEAVNLLQHPNMLKVPWSNFTINAGDCLFLPKSYYHQVDSDGPFNLAVSILFSRFDRIFPHSFSDCTSNTEYIIPRPLSDLPVMWAWAGKGIMSMGYGDFEESYRLPLLQMWRQLNKHNRNLTAKYMERYVTEGSDGKIFKNSFEKAFNVFDTDGDKVLSRSEIQNATWDQLRVYGELSEYYEPSNSYEFEYSFISYGDVKRVLKSALKFNDVLTKEKWVKTYQNRLSGTRAYAEEIYSKLVQSNTTTSLTTKDVTADDVERALAKWTELFAPQYAPSDDDIAFRKRNKRSEEDGENGEENTEDGEEDLEYDEYVEGIDEYSEEYTQVDERSMPDNDEDREVEIKEEL